MGHKFHIPVLGLGYSIDTPLKVARYGISSVVSVVDDDLTERMREFHSAEGNEEFVPIAKTDPDCRARRITAYLNLLGNLVDSQFDALVEQSFACSSDIDRYFALLPDSSTLKQGYELMMEYPECESKRIFANILRKSMKKGSIDVNIMAKVDKMNYAANGESLGDENTDALTALRGFAKSNLNSSVILSAGMNPRLYSYLEQFPDFFPDEQGTLKKRITLKVSDFRSAFIQAKFLAKKGIWVSEFRIESGLNCGGHAFATDGYLLGPILEEFKNKREEMLSELREIYTNALVLKSIPFNAVAAQKISVQGGIGTAEENAFLLEHYDMDITGWGSPFLLVPEATNVDNDTLNSLISAENEDYYLSNSSPLGILFNSFRGSSSEKLRDERIKKGRPGSPCTKKYLVSNTEFTEQPICTASRAYQHLKIKQLKTLDIPAEEYQKQVEAVTEKVCLCEGLCASAYLKNGISKPRENKAVSICPGPNLAYFSGSYTLDEMVGHIYGWADLLKGVERPHIFINELNLYIDYFQKDLNMHLKNLSDKKQKYLQKFRSELESGIAYYRQLFPKLLSQTQRVSDMLNQLVLAEQKLNTLQL